MLPGDLIEASLDRIGSLLADLDALLPHQRAALDDVADMLHSASERANAAAEAETQEVEHLLAFFDIRAILPVSRED